MKPKRNRVLQLSSFIESYHFGEHARTSDSKPYELCRNILFWHKGMVAARRRLRKVPVRKYRRAMEESETNLGARVSLPP